MTKEVEPDYKHVWKLVKSILLLPITLILVIARKKEAKELLETFKVLWEYFWEAKVTAWLIVINIVVHLILLFYLGSMDAAQQDAFSKQNLLDGPANLLSLNLLPFVANWFVHGSWSHLFGNMVALLLLGRVVEKNFGTGKFCFIYFGSAIVSGLVDDLVHIGSLSYYSSGASGAIAGLASAAMLVEPFYLVMLFVIPIPVFVFGWLQLYTDVTGVLNPTDSGVANFAHLGGFFAIGILAFFLSKEDKSKLWRGLLINLATLVVLGLAWFVAKR
ncbi:rhomboid family intramembrane serine protease [Candidatus Woesearchaeota archaeon]|nr:rhomboid family intramembrane serine protease [Candidatus Woesearchaeota archaeon]